MSAHMSKLVFHQNGRIGVIGNLCAGKSLAVHLHPLVFGLSLLGLAIMDLLLR